MDCGSTFESSAFCCVQKLQQVDSLWKEFETPEKANKVVKLKHFEKFQDTTEALAGNYAEVKHQHL
uniref:Nucleolar protein 58/56 N-terminal domain-containing protein n=1 Tax=Sinocyclocheilus grahami TaxID=75366 RepID=A0A672T1K0_SINGR